MISILVIEKNNTKVVTVKKVAKELKVINYNEYPSIIDLITENSSDELKKVLQHIFDGCKHNIFHVILGEDIKELNYQTECIPNVNMPESEADFIANKLVNPGEKFIYESHKTEIYSYFSIVKISEDFLENIKTAFTELEYDLYSITPKSSTFRKYFKQAFGFKDLKIFHFNENSCFIFNQYGSLINKGENPLKKMGIFLEMEEKIFKEKSNNFIITSSTYNEKPFTHLPSPKSVETIAFLPKEIPIIVGGLLSQESDNFERRVKLFAKKFSFRGKNKEV